MSAMLPAVLLALLLGPLSAAAAGSADTEALLPRLADANKLYENSDFDGAVKEYTALLRYLPDSATLNYNLANAYFRLGKPGTLGQAIASYQRAFAANPRDADIRYNYDFALRRAGETLIPGGTPKALFLLFHFLNRDEILALQWIGLWASLLLASVYLLKETLQTRLRPYLTGVIVFWAVFAAWLGLHHALLVRAPGVVITQDAEVRSGPGENFPVSFRIPEGRRVATLDAKGDWMEIGILKEGMKGWISLKDIEKI